MDINLTERKRKILRALAEENIRTNEPVSSQVLAERYFDDISSATIRNELAAMEEQGVISKTHTSSGRIPTALGFKMFINEILPLVRPTAKEVQSLRQKVSTNIGQMESIVSSAAQTLSEICNLPSVVLSGISSRATVRAIKIVKISDGECLVVVSTSEGYIKDIIKDSSKASEEACQNASIFLSRTFEGKTLGSIKAAYAEQEFAAFKSMVAMLLKAIENQQNGHMATSGHAKLLDKMDSKNTRAFLDVIDNREKLKKLVEENAKQNEISVSVTNVGGADCAVVSLSTHSKSGEPISLAVMGPARMDYEKAIKALKGISKIMDEEQQ